MLGRSVQIQLEDLWFMLVATIRYSLGRRTYATSLCADLYGRYGSSMTSGQRRQIRREICEALWRARPGRLGDDCDHRAWLRLARRIGRELRETSAKERE